VWENTQIQMCEDNDSYAKRMTAVLKANVISTETHAATTRIVLVCFLDFVGLNITI